MTAAALGQGALGQGSQRALEVRIAELERENAKLVTVRDALIRQVDRSHDFTGNAYKLFQSVAELETSVEKRIQRLARAMSEAKIARQPLQHAIDAIGEGFLLYDSNDRIVLCNHKYRAFFPITTALNTTSAVEGKR